MFDVKFVKKNESIIMGHNKSRIIVMSFDGIDGIDVNVNVSRGFKQSGYTLDSVSIGAREMMLMGKMYNFSTDDTRAINRMFYPGSEVRVWFENKYWIDAIVKTSPIFAYSGTVVTFSIAFYCPYPYWRGKSMKIYNIGDLIGGFNFPVSYNMPHNFALFSETEFTNCVNDGNIAVIYELEIKVRTGAPKEIKIENALNQKYVKFSGSFASGDRLRMFYENNILRVTKIDADNVTENAINCLDIASNLFKLEVGDNLIKSTVTVGTGTVETHIKFYDIIAGVTYAI